ncbi:hypothetical protein CISIN_1g043220mg, partial [Citrus sinensis]
FSVTDEIHNNETREVANIEGNEKKENSRSLFQVKCGQLRKFCVVATKIRFHEVVILISSGSTANFVSDKVAALLPLPMMPTKPFSVRIANGAHLKSPDVALDVKWSEQIGSIMRGWKKDEN